MKLPCHKIRVGSMEEQLKYNWRFLLFLCTIVDQPHPGCEAQGIIGINFDRSI
jgi:hypothetical protein